MPSKDIVPVINRQNRELIATPKSAGRLVRRLKENYLNIGLEERDLLSEAVNSDSARTGKVTDFQLNAYLLMKYLFFKYLRYLGSLEKQNRGQIRFLKNQGLIGALYAPNWKVKTRIENGKMRYILRMKYEDSFVRDKDISRKDYEILKGLKTRQTTNRELREMQEQARWMFYRMEKRMIRNLGQCDKKKLNRAFDMVKKERAVLHFETSSRAHLPKAIVTSHLDGKEGKI